MTVLEKIRQNALDLPNQTVITEHLGLNQSDSLTFAQLEAQSSALATELAQHGLVPGQMAGIFMQRCPAHVVAMIAILKTGAAFFSLNPRLSLVQITFSLKLCQAPILLVDSSSLLRLSQATEEFNNIKIMHLYTGTLSPVHQQLLKKNPQVPSLRLESSPAPIPPVADIPSDPALALFTSGSTGNPKGVLISRQDLFNRVTREINDFELQPSDRLLGLLPFSFDVGLNQLFSALLGGIELVLSNSWLPRDICATVKNYQISGISAVPAIWTELLTLPKALIQATFQSVRYLTVSGGDLAIEQLMQLREFLPACGIYKTYGQTETFRSGILKPAEFAHKMTSVGHPVKGTQVFIINSKGKPVPPGQIGQIIHRGDGTMLGYVGDPSATRKKLRPNPRQTRTATFRQPVIYTGDLGKMDADGFLYIMGRKDKMLKINGYRIYPGEIQNAILAHEAVLEAVAFGVKTTPASTQIFAEVRCKESAELNEHRLKQFLATRLPSYMQPAKIIFVTSFPRTGSGKIRLAQVEEKYHV
jgi:amino acid adenylation domain-containing protein